EFQIRGCSAFVCAKYTCRMPYKSFVAPEHQELLPPPLTVRLAVAAAAANRAGVLGSRGVAAAFVAAVAVGVVVVAGRADVRSGVAGVTAASCRVCVDGHRRHT